MVPLPQGISRKRLCLGTLIKRIGLVSIFITAAPYIMNVRQIETHGFIARQLTELNSRMREEGRNYVLLGYGRWGSSIDTLGVPVQWGDISETKVLVECGLPNFHVEPSQGTHFFQNLTSFGVGYFTVNPFTGDGSFFDSAWLDAFPAEFENEYIRVVRFSSPLLIGIDGRKSVGVVLKPGAAINTTENQNTLT